MKPAEIKDLTELLIKLKTNTKEACEQNVQKNVEVLFDKMRLLFVEQAVVEIMSNYYDFGEVTSVTRLFGGLINQNFSVTTNNGNRCYRLFIKRYRREASVKEILFEHKCNEYLTANDFPEIAKLIKTRDGRTFVEHRVKHLDPPNKPSKFAVYTYLEGEDRYEWKTPNCSMSDLASASSMLAKIHERGFGFKVGEHAKEESKIIALMDEFRNYFSKFEEKAQGAMKGSKSANYFLEKLPSYLKALGKCQQLKEKCKGMLELMVHCDYHPGNQKYSDNGVIGIFDFDWCKEDLRLFDVAITITYFCTSWKNHENGVLFLDEIKVFLEAYQERLKNSNRIYALTKEELAVLPEMIILANMYVIWWDLREIFEVEQSESDEEECLVYLDHNTKINDYALEHLEEIRAVADKISV
jgi:homoserine kinase type II